MGRIDKQDISFQNVVTAEGLFHRNTATVRNVRQTAVQASVCIHLSPTKMMDMVQLTVELSGR